jgi:hypothetical protein
MDYGQFLMSKKVLVEMTRFHFSCARKNTRSWKLFPIKCRQFIQSLFVFTFNDCKTKNFRE